MSRIDEILVRPSVTLAWLSSVEGKIFLDWTLGWLIDMQGNIEKVTDYAEIFRLQGKIEVLKRIVFLKDEIQKYQRDLIKGEVRQVKEGKHGVV